MEGQKPQFQVEAESALWNAIRENLVGIFLEAPTLPVVVCFRRSVGFRVAKLTIIYGGFFLLGLFGFAALAVDAAAQQGPLEGSLLILASFAYAGIAIYWRQKHWGMIRRAELWHTRSRGVSFLAKVLPLRETYIQRFVEPAICLVLGLALFTKFHFIGAWFILSAFGLALLEQLIYDQQLNMMLDQYDGIIDGELAGKNAKFFSGETTANEAPPTIEQMSGVSVVVAPELRAMIEQRRREKQAKATTQ